MDFAGRVNDIQNSGLGGSAWEQGGSAGQLRKALKWEANQG